VSVKKHDFLETCKGKHEKARLSEMLDLVRKNRAFGSDAKKKARLFGMQILFVKVGLLEVLQRKKPDIWDADFVRKSRAFGNLAKKEKAQLLDVSFRSEKLGFCAFSH